jgi:sulfopyruvate decarboxylase subunit alpha
MSATSTSFPGPDFSSKPKGVVDEVFLYGGRPMKKEAVDAIVTGLKQAGINFVSMLPDSDFTDAQKAVMADKSFTCVPVSNEAIGFGVCAGAWVGGKKTALLITTDGIMASAFPLTTLNMGKNIPVLMVIPYRGSLGDGIWFVGPMAFTTEPLLKDLQVAYTVIDKIDEVAHAIKEAQLSAEAWLRPAAVLLAGEVIFEEA